MNDVKLRYAEQIAPENIIAKLKASKQKGDINNLCHEVDSLSLVHSFQLVSGNFPIPTDGILERDFLIKFRCNIDYENWLLNFNFQNHVISIPIEDNINDCIILPPRCELIRKLPNFIVNEVTIVPSQEILPGIFVLTLLYHQILHS